MAVIFFRGGQARAAFVTGAVCAWLASGLAARAGDNKTVPEDQLRKMTAALPLQATVKPAKPRKLLIFNLTKGFWHDSIPMASRTIELMGQKTGAWTATASEDPAVFRPENLKQYDGVCFNNTTGELFTDKKLKDAFLEYVRSGKGVVGIHAATDCFYQWPEYGDMMGGYFDGHPWNETVHVKIDDPAHPLNAVFEGQSFDVADEIYQFRDPYSRDSLHILLSLDVTKTNMQKGGIKRTDGDFAVSWVRSYGQGRVFYCSLGHRREIFWNQKILRHYLDGIQFALGDLPADTTPSARPRPDPFMGDYEGTFTAPGGGSAKASAQVVAEGNSEYRAILTVEAPKGAPEPPAIEIRGRASNDKVSLSGVVRGSQWTGTIQKNTLVAVSMGAQGGKFDLRYVLRRSPTEGARPPAEAVVLLPYGTGTPTLDEWDNKSWTLLPDGSMQVGKGDIRTKRQFGDARIHIEFMTPFMPTARGQGRGNSGVYIQDRYEVQVLDSYGLVSQDNDCGGIYKVAKPKVNACYPPGSWQTYDITFRAPRFAPNGSVQRPAIITVVHNGVTIHENQPVPNPTGGGAGGIVKTGPLRLQDHGNPVKYRNIWLVELHDEP